MAKKNFFKKFKWLITLAVVLVSAFTGIDLSPVQKDLDDSVNDSTKVQKSSTNELGDSISNDTICFTTDSCTHEK